MKNIFNLFFLILVIFYSPFNGYGSERQSMIFYVGTYTSADSQGIEAYRLQPEAGKLQFVKIFPGIRNASFLRFSANGRFLYAVNELSEWHQRPSGAVSAFAVDPQNGDLHLINQVSSQGRAPCYLTVSANGHFVLFNNYLDGTALSYSVRNDGGLGALISLMRFHGSGIVKGRQDAPHVHSINLNPQNTFALVADLGTDHLTVLAFNDRSGELSKVRTVQTAPGSGPRHTVFSADGTYLYVANELSNSVDVYSFVPSSGLMSHLQTVSTLPANVSAINYPADIHLSPDGRFLYVSNRGHESIARFSVQSSKGTLSFFGTDSVYGSWPRNFGLTPDGAFLIVANQKSHNLVLFRRNAQTGRLQKVDEIATVAAPACIAFLPF